MGAAAQPEEREEDVVLEFAKSSMRQSILQGKHTLVV